MASPTTASRSTADYSRRYLATLERFDSDFDEVVYEANEVLWIFAHAAEKKFFTGGEDIIKAHTSYKNTSAEVFQGTDVLTIDSPLGPSAAKWAMANYKVSMLVTWQESMQNSGDVQQVDLFQEQYDNAALALAEFMNDAVKIGQGATTNSAKHFQGLEDAIAAYDDTDSYPAENWTRTEAFSASANTYAGINRGASDDGAVGWRNLSQSVNGNDLIDSGTSSSYNFTGGLNSDIYNVFKRAMRYCKRGSRRPDLVLMSLLPYEEFEYLSENAVRFEKGTGGGSGSAEIPFDNLMFRDAIVIQVEGIEHSGGTGDAAEDDETIYILNTAEMDLCCESQAYFAWTDFYEAGPTQLAAVAHNIFRGTPRIKNPRYCGVLHGYGDAT